MNHSKIAEKQKIRTINTSFIRGIVASAVFEKGQQLFEIHALAVHHVSGG